MLMAQRRRRRGHRAGTGPRGVGDVVRFRRNTSRRIIRQTVVPQEQRHVFLGHMAAAMLAVLGVGLAVTEREAKGGRVITNEIPDLPRQPSTRRFFLGPEAAGAWDSNGPPNRPHPFGPRLSHRMTGRRSFAIWTSRRRRRPRGTSPSPSRATASALSWRSSTGSGFSMVRATPKPSGPRCRRNCGWHCGWRTIGTSLAWKSAMNGPLSAQDRTGGGLAGPVADRL